MSDPQGLEGPAFGDAHEELGVELPVLLEAKVTLVVSGTEKPIVKLEVELKSGRKITHPLPEQHIDRKKGTIRLDRVAEWLMLDQATLVDALANSNVAKPDYLDKAVVAAMLQVDEKAPVSAKPLRLRKPSGNDAPTWSLRLNSMWKGITRLPLGSVAGLAAPEKMSVPPAGAETISYDDPAGAASTPLPLDERDQALAQRGCLAWFTDHKGLAAGAAGAVLLLLVASLVIFGGDDGGSGTGARQSDEAAETGGDGSEDGATVLAVGAFADRLCRTLDENLSEAQVGLQQALDEAGQAPVATQQLYSSLAQRATDLAQAFEAGADALESSPPPDIDGGEAAQQAEVEKLRAAAMTAAELAAVFAGFDPLTATEAENQQLGTEVNRLLTELDETLNDQSGANPELTAALEASAVCADLNAQAAEAAG